MMSPHIFHSSFFSFSLWLRPPQQGFASLFQKTSVAFPTCQSIQISMKVSFAAVTRGVFLTLLGCSMTILPMTTHGFATTAPTKRSPSRNLFSPSRLLSFNEATNDAAAPISPPTGVNGASKEDSQMKGFDFEKLRQVSNFASILCVIDCTVLPIVTIILPLLGIMNLAPAQLEFLHELGHGIALFFVLPVGSLTSALNYMSHKKSWITSLGVLGLTLIALANSHLHALPFVGDFELLHSIQHGALHRVVNLLGCSFLLGSNYLSQKQGCAHHDHGPGCSHDHTHCDHDHDH